MFTWKYKRVHTVVLEKEWGGKKAIICWTSCSEYWLIPRSWWSINGLNRVFNFIVQGGPRFFRGGPRLFFLWKRTHSLKTSQFRSSCPQATTCNCLKCWRKDFLAYPPPLCGTTTSWREYSRHCRNVFPYNPPTWNTRDWTVSHNLFSGPLNPCLRVDHLSEWSEVRQTDKSRCLYQKTNKW